MADRVAAQAEHLRKFYIGGQWVDPLGRGLFAVINPATEEVVGEIAMGTAADVDRAVKAARAAFESFSLTSREQRLALLKRMLEVYNDNYEEFARAMSIEMGAPKRLAIDAQAWCGRAHFEEAIDALGKYEFETLRGTTLVRREAIGVVGCITPWNWPINQIVTKVAPALAAGCTIVLKPAEVSPLSGLLFADVLHEAGVPPGVFNLVNGDGATVGHAMSAHPDIDMMSITGSTRAGIDVARTGADTVKRIHQELGGKSANIILDDVNLEQAVADGVAFCFNNAGQTCAAPTRMFVPAAMHDRAAEIARQKAESYKAGDTWDDTTTLGPMASEQHYNKVQSMIAAGIKEGARLVTGGLGRPEGVNRGYFVRPTVFANVQPGMRIAREEIFGPVLSILTYKDEADAIRLANDTVFGLGAYIAGKDMERARRVAARMRAGYVTINYAAYDVRSPFGGYKQSGNGREYSDFGIDEFLEVKGIVGYKAA